MSDASDNSEVLRVSGLNTKRETRFELVPDPAARQQLADALGFSALRKVRFSGQITPEGKRGWALNATLGATIVQPCVITLEPVSTRIDTPVSRRFVPAELIEPGVEDESEVEMPEDDTLEPLSDVIDLSRVLAEALALAAPQYPRAKGAELGAAQFAEDGVTPMKDDDVKPFAGLKALRDKLDSDD